MLLMLRRTLAADRPLISKRESSGFLGANADFQRVCHLLAPGSVKALEQSPDDVWGGQSPDPNGATLAVVRRPGLREIYRVLIFLVQESSTPNPTGFAPDQEEFFSDPAPARVTQLAESLLHIKGPAGCQLVFFPIIIP